MSANGVVVRVLSLVTKATHTTRPCEHSAIASSGILHGRLEHHTRNDEHTAWGHRNEDHLHNAA